jgi:hypothetical protein
MQEVLNVKSGIGWFALDKQLRYIHWKKQSKRHQHSYIMSYSTKEVYIYNYAASYIERPLYDRVLAYCSTFAMML